ncbi:MAG TPA: hypothetical protein VKF79_07670 [Candidatus Acidoferrum sp.]|nr:hypothetical protein [Candidatus Acidoferrum sp.]
MERALKVMLLAVLTLLAAVGTNATAPTTWIDVVDTYGADPTCTKDAGPAINSAIAGVSGAGGVLFFQTGCYLIQTQILDTNAMAPSFSAPGITYLGYGRVTFLAGAGLTGSIMQFGDGNHIVRHRKISNIVFACGPDNPPGNAAGFTVGLKLDGLTNSEFDDVEIRRCSNFGLETFGDNPNNDVNFFGGEVIAGPATPIAGYPGKIVNYGVLIRPNSDGWSFHGTLFDGSLDGSAGVGIEVDSSGFTCAGCTVRNWEIGLAAALISTVNGVEVSGGTYSGNAVQIRAGLDYGSGSPIRVHGLSIHGASIESDIQSPGALQSNFCVDLQQVDGFAISGNHFRHCELASVRGLAEYPVSNFLTGGTYGGILGPNDIAQSGPYDVHGHNITLLGDPCNVSVSPAFCNSGVDVDGHLAQLGSGTVVIAADATSVTILDTFVNAGSRIFVSEDLTLGPKYDVPVTCNTAMGRTYSVTSKIPGKSFTITASAAPVGSPACLAFRVDN